ncbi:MAG: transcription-repair coupling factor [Phycisphaerales bacterium]
MTEPKTARTGTRTGARAADAPGNAESAPAGADPSARAILTDLARSPAAQRLAQAVEASTRVVVRHGTGGSACGVTAGSLLSGALSERLRRPVLLIVAHVDDADEAHAELESMGVAVRLLPALEALPGESSASVDLLAARLGVLEGLSDWAEAAMSTPSVLIAPIHALMQSVPDRATLARALLTLRVGQDHAPGDIVRWLDTAGYRRTDAVGEPGDFAIRGGILDIFPPGEPSGAGEVDGLRISTGGVPVRLDFFGDTIERMSEVDPDTMGADRAIDAVRLVVASVESLRSEAHHANFLDLLPRDAAGRPLFVGVLAEVMELTEQARGYFERVTDPRGIFGPPAVFAAARKATSCLIECTAIGQYASGEREAVLDWPTQAAPAMPEDASQAIAELVRMARGGLDEGQSQGMDVLVVCENAGEQHRLGELLRENAGTDAAAMVGSCVAHLHQGVIWTGESRPRLIIGYAELLGRVAPRRRVRTSGRLRAGRAMDTFLDLQVGDYVVHTEHGIARFTGLKLLRPGEGPKSVEDRLPGAPPGAGLGDRKGKKGSPARAAAASPSPARPATEPEMMEFLTLEFDAGAKLHVPAMNVDQVQKYVGSFSGRPKLSTLGGQGWKKQKERVSESVRDLAAELLRVRAARESMPGIRYPDDTPWQRQFEDEFPYDETEDQLAALSEIKRDMQATRPMDRLLCGDVGYGKTELAIRAVFKAIEVGKQAAVLVPTTVLAEQHERTFAARMRDYPFRVASLSRFKTTREINQVLEDVREGRVDVVIGTHRLLSKDVGFKDLGLVIIDEEQRFGVEHKERLLSLRMIVDVLTLSATPIPRTLHMSMLGLRDISSLATAPSDRRAVVTDVAPYNEMRIRQAIARELARDGQVFFVHNRIHNILSVADDIRRMAPDARIDIGHGQMADGELEQVMLRFMRRQTDILVSTTIIESGIDIPSANTIFINDADRFGLAELHQLRGRVGRGKHRGYCYLLLPADRPMKENAQKRLKAIEQYSMLGAGFKIAMRDLEIRGAGNILGPEQSGHIAAVGYDMYCQLLDKAVRQLRNEVTAAPSETTVDIGIFGTIPRSYIPADIRRLEAYRRVALASTRAELDKVQADLLAAYGPLPPGLDRLIQLAEVRIGARHLGIRSVTVRDRKDVVLRTTDPSAVVRAFHGVQGTVTALPIRTPGEVPEVYFRPPPQSLEPPTLLAILRKRVGQAAAGAGRV